MRRHRATRLIHGHTHRPADHPLVLDGTAAWRQVLAEWHPDRAEALVRDPAGWSRQSVLPSRVMMN
jgi:UDP-2,3-diacylglucosamine hydrolase